MQPDVVNGQPVKARYCNFDRRHGEVEFYDNREKHLGAWRLSNNGQWIQSGAANPTRDMGN